MHADLISILLDDYNAYRAHTAYFAQLIQRVPVRSLKMEKARAPLTALIEWCVVRGLEPRRWLYWLFDRSQFRYAPKLNALQPKNEVAAIEKYQAMRRTPLLDERLQQARAQVRRADGRWFDPNRDLSAQAEARKWRYLSEGRPDLCIAAMFDNSEGTHPTWGYHPASASCPRCPLAAQCAMSLRAAVPAFDPIALRAGALTLEQARIAEGRYYRE